jgi:hypothetical protein
MNRFISVRLSEHKTVESVREIDELAKDDLK